MAIHIALVLLIFYYHLFFDHFFKIRIIINKTYFSSESNLCLSVNKLSSIDDISLLEILDDISLLEILDDISLLEILDDISLLEILDFISLLEILDLFLY